MRNETSPLCLAALAAALLGAPLPAQVPPSAGPATEATAARDGTASPDSVAARTLRACRGLLGYRRGCIERRLWAMLESAGIGPAMAALDRIAAASGGLRRHAHGLAHGLGIAAYRGPETLAETFAQCPATQISGCQHGVIQAYFLDLRRSGRDVGAAELEALCEPHRGHARFYECTHGMGHGLLALVGHRLPDALAKCDLVRDDFVRETCYGGAFMENIVGATQPGHSAEAHAALGGREGAAAADGHAHHGGGRDGHARPWKRLDRTDLLYPCTVVPERQWGQCYLIQTAAILYFNAGDVSHAARVCRRAPAAMVEVCYRSLGRDISSKAMRDPARSARLCARAGPQAEPACLAGAAVALVNVRSEPADGMALCRVVEGEAKKAGCYRAVGGASQPLLDAARREALCAAAEEAFAAACREGAGLPAREAAPAETAAGPGAA